MNIDLQKWHDPAPMYLGFEMPTFRGIMNRLLDEGNSYLAPVVRSEAAVRTTLKANLELMLSHSLTSRFKFVVPAEAIELLTQDAGRRAPARSA